MPGTDRFTGIIEAKTVGEAELQRFSSALEKVSRNLDQSGQTASKQAAHWNRFAEQVRNAPPFRTRSRRPVPAAAESE